MRALRYLLIIGILFTATGFTSDILGKYLGPIDYKGYLVFDYPEGENSINNIVFNVDSSLADNLIIVNVPSSWSHSYEGGTLTLSDGSLGPGESVRVTVSLNKYFEDGEYPVSSVGTTTAGEVSQASGPLLVGELYLLNFLGMASAFRFPLAALVLGLGFLELRARERAAPIHITGASAMTFDGVVFFREGKEGKDELVEVSDLESAERLGFENDELNTLKYIRETEAAKGGGTCIKDTQTKKGSIICKSLSCRNGHICHIIRIPKGSIDPDDEEDLGGGGPNGIPMVPGFVYWCRCV